MTNRKYKTTGPEKIKTDEKRLLRWRQYYYTHHQQHLNRNRKYYLERMFEWYEWFEEMGYGKCAQCGYDKHPKAIDFHHRNPETKSFGIGKFINGRQCNEENKHIVLDELKKCECLCANCHRIHHFVQSNEHTDAE